LAINAAFFSKPSTRIGMQRRGFWAHSFKTICRVPPEACSGASILQNPRTQGKLVSVLRGQVRDVAVDVRVGSPTFGRHVAVDLSEENRRQLWVPRGFAHGFVVLSESADFFYKCDEFYSPSDEIVVRWDDPALGIGWGVESPTLSGRDAAGRLLADVQGLPAYGHA
jgi:dTDP-4-dehydrorhamnose 3,5-epimerase